jgi:cyclase
VKTKRFKDPVYLGDPVNAVRIFSDKEADEIVVLDIDASREHREPNYRLIAEMAGEAFMPMGYGGGVRTVEQVRRLIRAGVEKVVINTAAIDADAVVREAAAEFGSQAIVGAIDVKRTLLGRYRVMSRSGTVDAKRTPEEHARRLVALGAGEVLLNSIDRDGTMEGFDLQLVRSVSSAVSVPLVACGGAGSVEHLRQAIRDGGAAAVAAGSMFVFHGRHRAVLINYPEGLSVE